MVSKKTKQILGILINKTMAPFISKKQSAKCFSLKRKGLAKGWNCEEFASKTDYENLPKKKKKFKRTPKT